MLRGRSRHFVGKECGVQHRGCPAFRPSFVDLFLVVDCCVADVRMDVCCAGSVAVVVVIVAVMMNL